MEFKDVVYGRRSVRRFKDTLVDDKILKEIVDAALWAPSGVNLQPWYYVVIRTPEKMTRLKEMMSVVSDRDRPHLEERFSAHPEVVKTTLSFISTLGGAPAVVLAFRDKPDYTWALLDEGVVQSVAASMENLVLSAYNYFCTIFPKSDTDNFCDRKTPHSIIPNATLQQGKCHTSQ